MSFQSNLNNLNETLKLFMDKFSDTTRSQPSDTSIICKLDYLIKDGFDIDKTLKQIFETSGTITRSLVPG